MSMISAQCDELRKTADELQDILDNGHNYTCSGFVAMMHQAQQELCDAADTIWELRCKLADVVDQRDEIERLVSENAKLRELVQEAVDVASLKDMRDWRYGKRLAFLREASELGIEVEYDKD